MNNMMHEGLFALLRQAARNPRTPVEAAAWESSFEAFRLHAAGTSNQSCTPALLRAIEQSRIECVELLRQFMCGAIICQPALSYCRKALDTLDAERRILLLRIRHPDFSESVAASCTSPLFLNDGFHASDLVELIVPLYEMRFCRTSGSSSASVKSFVAAFAWVFNTPLPNYDMLRRNVLNRKLRLTPLLDRMRDTLTELSER